MIIKSFVKRILLFVLLAFLLLTVVFSCIHLYYPGYVDASYLKLSQKHNGTLIIGTSRAAQAIEPSVLGPDVYNFAFTINTSPFNETYVKLIKMYHDIGPYNASRKHIICVDPWSIRTYENNPNELSNGLFEEILEYPVVLFEVFYLTKQLSLKTFITNFLTNEDASYVNEFGRLVVPYDSIWVQMNFEQKIPRKIAEYRAKPECTKGYYSAGRVKCLKQIIDYLKLDGEVVLVRLPVHEEIFKIEVEIAGDFDSFINVIALEKNINYINLMGCKNDLIFSDGNHLWNGHAKKLSEIIKLRIQDN